MFHREGYPSITLATLVLVLCIWLGISIESAFLGSLPIIAGVFLWIIILQFFRNPKRNTPKSEKGILAPSDGTVVKIEPFTDHEYFGEPLGCSITTVVLSLCVLDFGCQATRYFP